MRSIIGMVFLSCSVAQCAGLSSSLSGVRGFQNHLAKIRWSVDAVGGEKGLNTIFSTWKRVLFSESNAAMSPLRKSPLSYVLVVLKASSSAPDSAADRQSEGTKAILSI